MATGNCEHTKHGKTVVIAFDGSDYAKYAMKYFKEHVYMPSDQVYVVYCVELSEIITTEKTIYGLSESGAHISLENDDFKELIQREIQKIKDKLIEFSAYMKEIKLDGTVKSTHANSPGVGIIHIAQQLNAEFIVTGSRGHSSLRRTFLGSVSDYILHHSNVPVLIVTYPKETHNHKDNKDRHHELKLANKHSHGTKESNGNGAYKHKGK